MKIFFLASVSDKEKILENYRMIIRSLESLGHKVNFEHTLVSPDEIISMNLSDNEERAKKLLKEMLKCDCVVLEGTKSSMGVGYYISLALQRSVPVLFLSTKEYKGLYLASSNRLLKIRKYDAKDKSGLIEIIKDFTQFTSKKKLSNRFNLMISDDMEEFLNKISNDYGLSKADFIRDLIYQQMDKK